MYELSLLRHIAVSQVGSFDCMWCTGPLPPFSHSDGQLFCVQYILLRTGWGQCCDWDSEMPEVANNSNFPLSCPRLGINTALAFGCGPWSGGEEGELKNVVGHREEACLEWHFRFSYLSSPPLICPEVKVSLSSRSTFCGFAKMAIIFGELLPALAVIVHNFMRNKSSTFARYLCQQGISSETPWTFIQNLCEQNRDPLLRCTV